MQNTSTTHSSRDGTSKLITFARKHPVVTIVGVGGAGLLGGAELAGGILLGAGISALLQRQRTSESGHTSHTLREKSRAVVERVPAVVRQRARAVVDAARGKQPAPSPVQHTAASPAQEQRAPAQPDPDQPIESWTP